MTGFENQTNFNRVGKMLEILAHMRKSHTSNRASDEEWRAMLAPVVADMGLRASVEAARDADAQPAPRPVAMTPVIDMSLHATRDTLEAMTLKNLLDLLTMTAAEIDKRMNT